MSRFNLEIILLDVSIHLEIDNKFAEIFDEIVCYLWIIGMMNYSICWKSLIKLSKSGMGGTKTVSG